MPYILKNWSIPADPFIAPELQPTRLRGEAYGHPRFLDGTRIDTSLVMTIERAEAHKIVRTANSTYLIYPADVDPEAEKQHPGYFERVPTDDQKCRVCGCSHYNPCEGGCWWVEQDLCSACEEREKMHGK